MFYGLDDKPIKHLLGTENFEDPKLLEPKKVSQFSRERFKNFQESYLDVLNTQKTIENSDFMQYFPERGLDSSTKEAAVKIAPPTPS